MTYVSKGVLMPRPKRCRRICGFPDYWNFTADDSSSDQTVILHLDEFEVIRMLDYRKMTQEECASAMGVARTTVTGIYESARFKLADALVNGKNIRLSGGYYEVSPDPDAANIQRKGDQAMRVAVTYDNGLVGQHFGKTEQFKLYDIEDGKIKTTQVVGTNGASHGALAGFLRSADVDTLICGGLGMGAVSALKEAGVNLFPGVTGDADEAVSHLLAGDLKYDPDASCHHHDHDHDSGHCGHHCAGA